MKKFALFVLVMMALPAQAAEIFGGRVNAEKGVIELDVAYFGGCEEHDFALQLSGCQETFPVSCRAELLEEANGDMCEARVPRTIELSLAEYGLTDQYFSGGSLTIQGDNDSKVSLRLPQ